MANNNYASWYKFFPWKMDKVHLVFTKSTSWGGHLGLLESITSKCLQRQHQLTGLC